uniref:Uncharacterized protein n=1 Tax=Streptomyces phage Paedore TaxID=2108134 RepID=A0A2P1JTU9_9CAUD|nr:hypothetical protein KGG91_gp76 [Streptomyces phage Paedore]AVO22559.1 hypothetical protein PBI_PAEDORE_76 [Streptomyces phage Paedore]
MTKVPSNVVRCPNDNGPIVYGPVGYPHLCERCGGGLEPGQRPGEGYWTESYGYLVEVQDDDEGPDTEDAIEELGGALRVFASVLGDGMTASGVGGHFTCTEADDLAQALMVGGHKHQAMRFLEGHAEGDDDEDDLHGSVEDFEGYVLKLAGLPVPELVEEPEPETEPKGRDLPTVTVEELIILIGL